MWNITKARFLFIIVGLLLFPVALSCNRIPDQKSTESIPNNPPTGDPETPMDTRDQKWVILNEVPAGNEEIASLLFENDGYWTPSMDDVLMMEENIIDYLTQNPNEFHWQPPIWEQLDEYNRQYIGLERGGKKIIFGNFFCESGKQDWKKDLIFAIDGGECYFQIEYDLENGFFTRLQVNGES